MDADCREGFSSLNLEKSRQQLKATWVLHARACWCPTRNLHECNGDWLYALGGSAPDGLTLHDQEEALLFGTNEQRGKVELALALFHAIDAYQVVAWAR